MEAAADEVVHAAERHPVERAARHLRPRRGAAGTRAPAPAGTSARGPSRPSAGRSPARGSRLASSSSDVGERLAPTAAARADERMCSVRFAARALDLVALVAPRLGDAEQHLLERRQPVPRLGREVGAAEERLAGGRQEDGHRPAAAAGQRDDGVHVDRVEVGPLLAVDLDADEVLVHARARSVDPRTTRAPSRGTSGRPRSRSRAGSAGPRRALARAPRRPTGTSRPGSPRAAAGTATSRPRGGSSAQPADALDGERDADARRRTRAAAPPRRGRGRTGRRSSRAARRTSAQVIAATASKATNLRYG